MKYICKKFQDLEVDELYEILRLRSKIFVVDLNNPLEEIDGLDKDAMHAWIEEDGRIFAYVRILDKGVQFDSVSFGRIFSTIRKQGYGRLVVEKAIQTVKELGEDRISLASQSHAKDFYEKIGFYPISDQYIDENGIEHHDMAYDIH